MSLYDALFLYGLAIRDAYEEARNQSVFLNGALIWRKMTSRQFIGATGQVLMNNKGVRVPSYATYYVRNGSMLIVVELTARLLGDKVKCAVSESNCSEHVCVPSCLLYLRKIPDSKRSPREEGGRGKDRAISEKFSDIIIPLTGL